MGLFSRKKEVVNVNLTADNILMEQMTNDDDQKITSLAKQLMDGTPLILNFDQLHVDRANKVIAFLSGVVYAVNGHIVEINETTYLFGNESLYVDGSVEQWLRNNIN